MGRVFVPYRDLWSAEGEAELMLICVARTTEIQGKRIIHLVFSTFLLLSRCHSTYISLF